MTTNTTQFSSPPVTGSVSETPRTDKVAFPLPVPKGEVSQGYVTASFARELEREIATWKRANDCNMECLTMARHETVCLKVQLQSCQESYTKTARENDRMRAAIAGILEGRRFSLNMDGGLDQEKDGPWVLLTNREELQALRKK